jgi:hypothetical protein
MFVAVVGVPRPEKALQSIPFPPWNDVDVQMGDTLAHPVVDCDECPFGLERLLNGGFQFLDGLKQRTNLLRRQISQCGDVSGRYQKDVAREKRSVIEKRHRVLAAPHNLGGNFP